MQPGVLIRPPRGWAVGRKSTVLSCSAAQVRSLPARPWLMMSPGLRATSSRVPFGAAAAWSLGLLLVRMALPAGCECGREDRTIKYFGYCKVPAVRWHKHCKGCGFLLLGSSSMLPVNSVVPKGVHTTTNQGPATCSKGRAYQNQPRGHFFGVLLF